MSLALAMFPVIAARRRLTVALAVSAITAAGNGNGPFTTATVGATVSGGAGGYSYAWTRLSGDASIAVSNSAIAAPTFSASGTAPATKSAVWQCAVTDSAGVVATASVTVTVRFQVSTLAVSVSTTSLSATGEGNGPLQTDRVERTISGGVAPYSTLWERVSGAPSPDITPNDGLIQNPYFIGTGTAPETRSAVWRCKVTDAESTVVYSEPVTIEFTFAQSVAPLSVSLSTNYVSDIYSGAPGDSGDASTGNVTATAAGGTGPYTYLWERMSGDTGTTPSSTTAATVNFDRSADVPSDYSSTWRCKVTDAAGAIAYSATVEAYLAFESNL